jgi:hypothetical protein
MLVGEEEGDWVMLVQFWGWGCVNVRSFFNYEFIGVLGSGK